jgi:hypothetical protein
MLSYILSERQEDKVGPVWRKINGEGKTGWIWCMYFVYIIENRIMKPVELVLRSRGGQWGRMMEEVNLIKMHYKHIYECHNEILQHNQYMLIKI